MSITRLIDLAEHPGFSGVVTVDVPGEVPLVMAQGWADRRHHIPNSVETRFGIASGTKGLTALTAWSMIDEGLLALNAPIRPVLGDDLPLIDDRVTVGQLLAHRSGIGDYLDESQPGGVNDYVLPVAVHQLDSTEAYLPVLDGWPQVFEPGERFVYNNSGFVVLALIVERVSDEPFAAAIHRRVCEPAGMVDTDFVRGDELCTRDAVGYLEQEGLRTNALHLPVLGSGDGGIFSTAADVRSLWTALFDHRIVSPAAVAEMVRVRSDVPDEGMRYGRGFWLAATGSAARLIGSDAGVSFATSHDPTTGVTYVVLANTSEGAWPIVRELDSRL